MTAPTQAERAEAIAALLRKNGYAAVSEMAERIIAAAPLTARVERLQADCRNYVTQLGESGLQRERLTALLAEVERFLPKAIHAMGMRTHDNYDAEARDLLARISMEGGGT